MMERMQDGSSIKNLLPVTYNLYNQHLFDSNLGLEEYFESTDEFDGFFTFSTVIFIPVDFPLILCSDTYYDRKTTFSSANCLTSGKWL
jgi:hypothetical protein